MNKIKFNKSQEYLIGIIKSITENKKSILDQTAAIEDVISKIWEETQVEPNHYLDKATNYLEQGKIKFTPNTTNSDVDEFLKCMKERKDKSK